MAPDGTGAPSDLLRLPRIGRGRNEKSVDAMRHLINAFGLLLGGDPSSATYRKHKLRQARALLLDG